MKTHNDLIQGSAQWHAHRARHWNASDCPAMLGCSPYETRQQLLHRMHTGITPDVDAGTQRRFDEGHRFEALARGLAEELIGDDLAPIVGTEGELSASFDGITFMGDTVWEHKTLGESLRYTSWDEGNGDHLPKHFRAQMEQQLMVSGAERVLFMATKWGADGDLIEERHCWYASDPALRREIIAGWTQFAVDLATYTPPAAAEPAAVAAPMESLPAVLVRMEGALTVHSNLDAFAVALRAFVAKIPASPSTDQEFADTEAACKALKRAEDALEAEEERALAGMSDVEQMRRAVADLRELARATRLQREKLVKARKESIRGEIVAEGVKAMQDHIAGLARRFAGQVMITHTPPSFGDAIKGLKTVDSIRNAVATELARAKIEANALADKIDANLRALPGLVGDRTGLTPDLQQLVLKSPEDFAAVVGQRVAAQRQAEEKRAAELAERERARVRAEEEARAAAKARMEQEDELERQRQALLAEQKAAEKARQDEWLASAEAREQARQAEIAEAMLKARQDPAVAARHEAMRDAVAIGITQTTVAQDGTPEVKHIPAANVVPMPTKAPADDGARMNLSDIKDRIAPLQITAEGLAQLGFPHVAQEKASKLYRAVDFLRMRDAMVKHLMSLDRQAAA